MKLSPGQIEEPSLIFLCPKAIFHVKILVQLLSPMTELNVEQKKKKTRVLKNKEEEGGCVVDLPCHIKAKRKENELAKLRRCN